MYFDRFDILEAWYLYLSDYHEGPFSEKYSRLSKLLMYFTPRDSLRSDKDLSENALEIYSNLTREGK